MASTRALSLYRSLLRAHKTHLPSEMRGLGDAYVKSEFRLHKSAEPEQVQRFFTEWEKYLEQILMTARAKKAVSVGSVEDESRKGDRAPVFQFGTDLSPDVELSEEQTTQLEKLREEALRSGGTPTNSS